MAIALLIITPILIVVIALWAIGSAVAKTSAMPDQIVVDVHEAIEFCAEALPAEFTARLTYDELRRVLRLHLEWIQAYHWSPSSTDATPIVFEQFDAVDYVMERAEITDLEITRAQATAVIQSHSDYLQVMGALHIDDPVDVEADLVELPLLDSPRDPLLTTTTDVDRDPSDDEPANSEPDDGLAIDEQNRDAN